MLTTCGASSTPATHFSCRSHVLATCHSSALTPRDCLRYSTRQLLQKRARFRILLRSLSVYACISLRYTKSVFQRPPLVCFGRVVSSPLSNCIIVKPFQSQFETDERMVFYSIPLASPMLRKRRAPAAFSPFHSCHLYGNPEDGRPYLLSNHL